MFESWTKSLIRLSSNNFRIETKWRKKNQDFFVNFQIMYFSKMFENIKTASLDLCYAKNQTFLEYFQT